MKKLLTGLMLATASFMLLFTVVPTEVYAVPHQEQFTLVKDPDFDYNVDLYGFLDYAYANYDDGLHPALEVEIDVLIYSTSSVSKAGNVYTLTFDTYIITVDNTTITSTGASIADGTYELEFFLEYTSYQDLFYEQTQVEHQFSVEGANDEVVPGYWFVVADGQSAHGISLYNYLEQTYEDAPLGVPQPVNFKIYMGEKDYDLAEGGTITVSDDLEYFLIYILNSDVTETIFKPAEILVVSDPSQHPQIGQTIDLIVTTQTNKPWTQAHDYGRIRTNQEVYLNYDEVNETVHLSNVSGGLSESYMFNPALLDYSDNNEAYILLQSPYPNFKYGQNPSYVTKENIAAVEMFITKYGTDYEAYFVFWTWELGGIVRNTATAMLPGEYINFEFGGNIRKAIDYQDIMVANVDELTPLEDFLQYLIAFDAIDGDISDQVYIVSDGGYDPEAVNVYHVEFGIENSNGVETTLIVPVHVVDIVAPVISGDNSLLQIGYNANFNVAAWVASLTVSDNYYTGLTISLVTDTYTANKTKLGTYEVKVRSIDPSGNETFLTRQIQVIDEVGPVVTGISTITASINENLTAAQIKMSLAASDAIDGNVTSSITIYSDGLDGNSSTPGIYEIVYMAVDAAGNQTFYTVTATIVASPPGFYLLNSNSIRLLPGATLTIQQILDILDASDASDISTNYNANIPGTYNLSFTLGGEDYQVSVTVLGANDPILPEPIIPEEPSNYNVLFYLLGAAATIAILVVVIKKRK